MTTDNHSLTADELAANLSARDNALIAKGLEMAMHIVRHDCQACQGTGHADAYTECEYCGRPLQSIRALKPATDYVVVPREPTEAMISEMHDQIDWCRNDQDTSQPRHDSQKVCMSGTWVGTFCEDDIRDAYAAMINTKE